MSLLTFPSPRTQPLQQADHAARLEALDVSQSFIVEAPAGSGKTGLLIQRYLRLLGTVDQPESVLALTFTRKAAAEMRIRVLDALQAAANPLPGDAKDYQRETWAAADAVNRRAADRGWQLHTQPHRLNLRTLDSLCAELARSSPVLSGGIGQATPLDDATPLYRAAARAVFLQLGGTDQALDHALRQVLLQRDANLEDCETLLAEMLATREQWASLVPLGRELLDETSLDANVRPRLDQALEAVLCDALTQIHARFSPGLLQRVASLAHIVAEADGHKDAPNPLRACASLPHAPGTAADDARHWQMLAHLLITGGGQWRKRFQTRDLELELSKQQCEDLKEMVAELQSDDHLLTLLCSLRELPPSTYPDDQWHMVKALFRLLYHALVELQLLFAAHETCDFAGLSLAARAALRAGDADRLGMRLEHLLIDEMQDTSSAQYDLLELLTAGWNGVDQTVFLVGDPKQSIYLFRQAKVERFQASMRTRCLGQIPLHPLRLTSNFRSGAGLVRRFNQTFTEVFRDSAPSSAHRVGYTAAEAALPATEDDLLQWHTTPIEQGDSTPAQAAEAAHRTEARTIASAARALHRAATKNGTSPPSIAVLVRARRHASLVIQELRRSRVPFRATEMETLAERPEVLDALAITRALLHPADRTAWLAILRAPWCGLTLAELHTVAAGDDRKPRTFALQSRLRHHAQALPAEAQLRTLRTLDVFDNAVARRGRAPISVEVDQAWYALQAHLCVTEQQSRNVRAYLQLLERLEAAGEALDLHRLGDELKRLFADTDSEPGAVEVLTIHKAKGLEWDAVFVPSMHRVGQRTSAHLLDWVELPHTDSSGDPLLLLAPIHKRGDEPGSLSRLVGALRSRAEAAELQRNFYVASTRARTALHLFGSLKTKADGEVSQPLQNSLLHAAWPAASAYFQPAPATALLPFPAQPLPYHGLALAATAQQEEPRKRGFVELRRLPLSILRQSPAHTVQASMPSASSPHLSRPAGSLAARTLGNTVHAFLQHIAELTQRGTPLPPVEGWSGRIQATVRAGGLSSTETARVAADVLTALRNSLADANGRWLLQPHANAINEGELFDVAAGPLQRYRFDRSFHAGTAPGEPGTGVLWIVDYKTSTRRDADQPGPAREEFLQAERTRYAPTLHTYARLALQFTSPTTPVMLALYYPMLPYLDWWSYDATAQHS